ncbi:hypothetical protein TcWFU_000547 [Taenia crassiceps]
MTFAPFSPPSPLHPHSSASSAIPQLVSAVVTASISTVRSLLIERLLDEEKKLGNPSNLMNFASDILVEFSSSSPFSHPFLPHDHLSALPCDRCYLFGNLQVINQRQCSCPDDEENAKMKARNAIEKGDSKVDEEQLSNKPP